MTSIKFCLKKFGDITDAEAVNKLVSEGLTEEQAIHQQLSNIDKELEEVAQAAIVSGADFLSNITEALTANPNGIPSFAYTAEEYDTMRLFSFDDGKAGFAIRRDGVIVSVFKHPDSRLNGVMDQLTQEAVEQGGTRLEAFEGFLTEAYAKNGFVELDRYEWDDNHSPDGWDKELMGTPDVVVMEINKELYDGIRENQSTNTERLQDLGRARTSDGGLRRESGLPEEQTAADASREEDGSLNGLPRQVGSFTASAWQPATDVANEYMATTGREYNPPSQYVTVDPERAAKIAKAFDEMKHDPSDPAVADAYKAMIDETIEQYRAVIDSGLIVEFIDGLDPYANSPRMMTDDVRDKNHMYVYSTREGFGSDDTFDPVDNPLLAETEFTISGQTALANDLFRVVHDYFGHVKEGVGFRADGEENTWRSHAAMFSPLAQKALTSETRGQNSWVNHGPHGEANRSALSEDTIFADQKIGILPDWVMDDATDGDLDMSQEATMQRARDMGFDTDTVWYHGTGADIHELKSSLPKDDGGMVFVTSDPSEASTFANLSSREDGRPIEGAAGNVLPLFVKADMKIFDVRDQGHVDQLMVELRKRGLEEDSERIKTSNYLYQEAYSKIMGELGFEGVFVKEGNQSDYHNIGIFNPSNIRSVNAKFDMTQEDSSNLLYQSVDQTETLDFKKWFENSVVVDEYSKPLIVHHGSAQAGFTVFDTTGAGKTEGTGAFFTQSARGASTYSNTKNKFTPAIPSVVVENLEDYNIEIIENNDGTVTAISPAGFNYDADTIVEAIADMAEQDGLFEEEAGNYEVYLSLKNPLIVDADGGSWNHIGIEREWFAKDEDGEIVEYFTNEADADHFRESSDDILEIEESFDPSSGMSTDDITREARESGEYDGVIFKNIIDEGPSGQGYGWDDTVYVVFNPEQIKSVDNVGTFDANNPNILYQSKGLYSGYEVSEVTGQVKEDSDSTGDLLTSGEVSGESSRTQAKDTFDVKYKQVETGQLATGFDTVTTPEQVAHVVASIRKHAQETFMVVVTDDMGKILNIIRHTKGLKNQSDVGPIEVIGAIASTEGAANVWFAHNHPSGNSKPSGSDYVITNKLIETAEGFDVQFKGHVIVGEGKEFSFFEAGDSSAQTLTVAPAPRKKKVSTTERVLRKRSKQIPALDNPESSKAYIESLDSDSGIVLMNNQHHPVGVVALSPNEMALLRDGKQVKRILSSVDTTNAAAVITFVKDASLGSAAVDVLNNLGNYLSRLDGLRHLDALYGSENGLVSVRESGGDMGSSSSPFYQENRGSFNPETMVIKLGKASDLSTFLHESAHFFLEMERQFVKDYGTTDDHKKLLKWLGVTSFDDITTEHHEKFAETFEVYLRTGKAPSASLRDAFTQFAEWLGRIYKTLTDSRLARADLSPDIKEVMDRLLATDAEIESALAHPMYDELFRSKEQAGMTDKQWADYQQNVAKRKIAAKGDINDKVLAEYRRRMSKQWKDEENEIAAKELTRLETTPSYQLVEVLKTYKMNESEVAEIVDSTITDAQRKKISKMVSSDEAAMNPVELADEFGFDNAKHMMDILLDLQPVKKAAQTLANDQMIEKYGDFINDGSLEAEVRQAVHNDEQAKVLMSEIKALDNKSKINRTYLKVEAKSMIASMKFGEIQPVKYYRNEIKAAQDAAVATDEQTKLQAKTRQIANHYLYKAAVETKEQIEKHRKYIKSVQSRDFGSTVEASYVANMKMLSESYDMRKNPEQPRNVELLINWMVTQLNDENDFVNLEILDHNLATMLARRENGEQVSYELPTWDEMTAAEIKSVRDMLKHMRFVGGQMSESSKAELVDERQAAADSVKKHSKKTISSKHVENKTDRLKDGVSRFFHSHRRLGGLFDMLDGFKEDGELAKQYDKVIDAGNVELELTGLLAREVDDAFKNVYSKINRRNEATVTKADGVTWTLPHRARFVVALNWGNEGNREAFLDGVNAKFDDAYTAEDVVTMLSTMSTEELDAVNAVWIAKEQLWPRMSAVSVRMTGVTPAKVESSPFTINGVHMVGGHYKLHYREDPNDAGRKGIEVDKNIQKQSISMSQLGTMIARAGSGGRQIDLELAHLFTDIQEDIHYIAYAEMARDMSRILKGAGNPLVAAIQRHQGVPFYKNLVDTVDGIVNPPDANVGVIWPFMKYIRSNLTYAYLAGSIRNIVQQPIALTNVIAQIGEVHTLKGIVKFYADPFANLESIRKQSMFMSHRTQLVNREAREQLTKIDSIHPVWGAIKQGAFAPQTFMDALIAYPAWMGAKDKYMAEHPAATEAKANKYADEMVAKTVGSGMTKDIGKILNATEAEKQITFMGTFFNVTYNLHAENLALLKDGQIGGFEYARRLGWMAVAPALLSVWLLSDLPEDPDDIPAHLMKEISFYNFSAIFLIRDLMSTIDGFTPSIPGLQAPVGLVRVGKEVAGVITGDEELDMETVASIIRGVQPLAPLPMSGQVARTLEGAADDSQTAWGSLVEGKDRN